MAKTDMIECEVWYLSDHGTNESFDREFGVSFKWDISLLEGYSYEFIKNYSKNKSIGKGFFEYINLGLIGKLLKLPKRSIIIVPGWISFSYVMAIIFGKIIGHKICLRGDSALNHEILKSRFSRIIKGFILKYLLFPCIYKFLYVGKQNEGFYKLYGIKDTDLILAPHAVDNDFFKAEKEKYLPMRNRIKESLCIPINHKVVLYCGKLIPKKNPVDLLNAFKVIGKGKELTLIFLGDGKLRNDIQHIISSEKIENVIITGFINQSKISEYYIIADIFVMCSGIGETWGLVTNEAMNFGLPIIVSDLTGNASDLVKGNGFVFRTNDVQDLSDKLMKILSLPNSVLKQMSIQSISIINNYSYTQIVEGLLKI